MNEAELAMEKAGWDKQDQGAEVKAAKAVAIREAELEMDVERKNAMRQTEKLNAEKLSKAKAIMQYALSGAVRPSPRRTRMRSLRQLCCSRLALLRPVLDCAPLSSPLTHCSSTHQGAGLRLPRLRPRLWLPLPPLQPLRPPFIRGKRCARSIGGGLSHCRFWMSPGDAPPLLLCGNLQPSRPDSLVNASVVFRSAIS
ncbi:hypothetical protein ZWY2020_042109 [Hordeum vulgare]|nr:hypothetical protein ZWY2020_042109 [Hordeum vulgare]